MRLSHPQLLILLLLLPLLGYLAHRTERHLGKIRAAFAWRGKRQAGWRPAARRLLPVLAASWMIFALAGPAVEIDIPQEAAFRTSLVVGLDVSKSMLAEDIMPAGSEGEAFGMANRLNLARRFLHRFLGRLEGEKTGLFFFAGRGLKSCLTPGSRILRYILQHADAMEMTESGSSLSEALKTARDMLAEGEASGIRTVLLISDGEDTGRDYAGIQQTLAFFAARQVRVFCLGVGKKQAVFIPVRKKGMTEADGFYRDESGHYLQTRLEEDLLRRMAAETGGAYLQLADDALAGVAGKLLAEIESFPGQLLSEETLRKSWLELAPLFLVLGLLSYTACLWL